MRYVFYFLTLALVFLAGMLVGNFYIPEHNESIAAAISMPPLNTANPALQKTSEEDAQQALSTLMQALSACPVVVGQEKDVLFNRISLFLTLSDFEVKKAAYEAEIAKNIENNRQTAQFSHAAAEYQTAKQRTEQRADELFPPLSADTDSLVSASTAAASLTVLSTTPSKN